MIDSKVDGEKEKREFTRAELGALIEGAIDLAVDHGILNPCAVKVERHGKTFIERGYRIADEKAYEDLMRLTYGSEEVKLRD